MKPTVLLLLLAVALPVAAAPAQSARPAAPAVKNGFRAEFLANLEDVENKYLRLAETIPADRYSWRPAKGVRSISEVFTHVAGSNYVLVSFIGVPTPSGLPQDFEAITDKQKAIFELRKSLAYLRSAAMSVSDADLEKSVNLFGKKTTARGVFTTILSHLHEHLGQSIAYARINGIAPPWSD